MNKKKVILFCCIVLSYILVLAGCGKEEEKETKTENEKKSNDITYEEAGYIKDEKVYDKGIIKAANVVLDGATFKKLIVDEEVGEDETYLYNVKTEELNIKGGGKNSVYILNYDYTDFLADKPENYQLDTNDLRNYITNILAQMEFDSEARNTETGEASIKSISTEKEDAHIVVGPCTHIEELEVTSTNHVEIYGTVNTVKIVESSLADDVNWNTDLNVYGSGYVNTIELTAAKNICAVSGSVGSVTSAVEGIDTTVKELVSDTDNTDETIADDNLITSNKDNPKKTTSNNSEESNTTLESSKNSDGNPDPERYFEWNGAYYDKDVFTLYKGQVVPINGYGDPYCQAAMTGEITVYHESGGNFDEYAYLNLDYSSCDVINENTNLQKLIDKYYSYCSSLGITDPPEPNITSTNRQNIQYYSPMYSWVEHRLTMSWNTTPQP